VVALVVLEKLDRCRCTEEDELKMGELGGDSVEVSELGVGRMFCLCRDRVGMATGGSLGFARGCWSRNTVSTTD